MPPSAASTSCRSGVGSAGVGGRGARDPGVIQGAGDPRGAVAGQPLGEHPRHHRRRDRVRLKAVRPPSLRGVHLLRVAARRRPAGTCTAGGRPGTGPAPWSGWPSRSGPGSGPDDLPPELKAKRQHQLLMILVSPHRAADLRRPQLDPVMGEQRRHRRVLAAAERPLVLPRSRSHPSPGPDSPARPPGPPPVEAAPTPASGSGRHRRTPPRSGRARLPGRRPAPAAAPVTSLDPASPQSRPGHKREPPTRPAPHRRRGAGRSTHADRRSPPSPGLNGEVLDPPEIQDVVTSIVGAPRGALHGCVDVREPPREAALFALDDRRVLRTSSEGQSMPTWRADSNVRFSRWRCPGPCGSAAALPGALAQGRPAIGTRLRWRRARLHARPVAGRWDC
jgi:hypothetical protein